MTELACLEQLKMSDQSSGSCSPKILSRASYIFEYSHEIRCFINKIGNIFQQHPDSLLRLDFTKEFLHVLIQVDIRFIMLHCDLCFISKFHFSSDFDEVGRYTRLFSEPINMDLSERKVLVKSKDLYEKFYCIFANLSVFSAIDVNTRQVIRLIRFN